MTVIWLFICQSRGYQQQYCTVLSFHFCSSLDDDNNSYAMHTPTYYSLFQKIKGCVERNKNELKLKSQSSN